MTKQQRNQIKRLNTLLPELNNCDMIINRWAKELMTLYPNNLRKYWHKDEERKEHWHLEADSDNYKYRKILVSNDFGIIHSNIELSIDTVLLISQAQSIEAKMFFWGHRDNPINWKTIKKIDKTSFSVNDEIKQYRQFKKETTVHKGKTIFDFDELRNFYNMSLVASCLKKTRKKGNQKSNQNSQAQSARGKKKAGKIVNGKYVKMVFDSANYDLKTEDKTVLDAYKTVAGKYGYKKSLRQFHRDLAKGKELRFDGAGYFCVYCTLMTMSSSPLKINIIENLNTENSDLNLNDSCILSGLNVIEQAQNINNNNPDLRPHEKEWIELCKSWNYDPKMCWSYEEYINEYYKEAS